MLLLAGSCWFLYPLLSAIFEDNNFHIIVFINSILAVIYLMYLQAIRASSLYILFFIMAVV